MLSDPVITSIRRSLVRERKVIDLPKDSKDLLLLKERIVIKL